MMRKPKVFGSLFKLSQNSVFLFLFLFLLLFVHIGCACKAPHTRGTGTAPQPKDKIPQADLAQWVASQEKTSWTLLQLNISPEEPKTAGGPKPRKGIVVAALHKKDPDYYFHWVRDSANVMRVVVDHYAVRGGDKSRLHAQMKDFLELSQDFQNMHSPYGLGEPRYTVEGQADTLPWSRPQYDGPALRALAVIRYLQAHSADIPKANRALAMKVLKRDIDYVNVVWNERGFDIWEELKAENFHTRVVQLSALVQSAEFLKGGEPKAVKSLNQQLNDHWDPTRNLLRSQLAIEKTDGYTKKQTDLDSAVVVAVIESERLEGAWSILDDRVQATVVALENLFRETFPLNQNPALGLAYGRYRGDVYYGGNPWYLITAYYAQFYYRLARAVAGRDFEVSPRNLEFVRGLLPERTPQTLKEVQVWKKGSAPHNEFMAACMKKADRILSRIQSVTPLDGQFFEQFDKVSGKPLSSRGIGWAHSAFIAASLERTLAIQKIPSRAVPKD